MSIQRAYSSSSPYASLNSAIPSQILTLHELQTLVKEKQGPLFVKFSAQWCGPCQQVAPIIDRHLTYLKSHTSPGAMLVTIDIDLPQNAPVVSHFRRTRGISSVPTLLLFLTDNRDAKLVPDVVVVGANIPAIQKTFQHAG